MSFVADSSITLTWCFEDEHTPATLALLDRVTADGAIAPWLWPLEAANGLLMAERRGRLDTERRHRLMGFLQELPITLDADGFGRTWTATGGTNFTLGTGGTRTTGASLGRASPPSGTVTRDARSACWASDDRGDPRRRLGTHPTPSSASWWRR